MAGCILPGTPVHQIKRCPQHYAVSIDSCTNVTQPTGNLDEETAMSIMQILEDSVHQMNKCAVIVTHSNEIAKKADVVFQLKRGTLHIVKNNEKV